MLFDNCRNFLIYSEYLYKKEFKKEYWCQNCYEKMMEEFMEIQEEEMYEYYRSISSYRY